VYSPFGAATRIATRSGHPNDLVLPAQLGLRQAQAALDQKLLHPVLLQIDERGPTVAGFRLQVELVDLLVPEKDPAHVPFDALADDPIPASQPVENFQRALGPADGARTDADGVVFIEHHHVDTALREIDRRAKTDRAGAGDDHRPMMRRVARLVWRGARIDRVGVRLH